CPALFATQVQRPPGRDREAQRHSGVRPQRAHRPQQSAQRIFVLQSREALEKVDGCINSHFRPPVILIVAYDPAVSWKREGDGKDFGEVDAAIVATQIMLQAADLGLGTTYVGMFQPEKLCEEFPEMAGLEIV